MIQVPEHTSNQLASRRSFFRWFNQVTIGASLAAIGLAAQPLQAQAKTNAQWCECNVISCRPDGACRADDPYNTILVHYIPSGTRCQQIITVCTNTCNVC